MWLIFTVEHVTTKSVYIVNYHWRGWQLKFGPLTFLLRRSSNPKGKFLSTGLLMAEETGHMTHQEVLKPNRRATGLLNAEQTGHTTQNGAPDQSHDRSHDLWLTTEVCLEGNLWRRFIQSHTGMNQTTSTQHLSRNVVTHTPQWKDWWLIVRTASL